MAFEIVGDASDGIFGTVHSFLPVFVEIDDKGPVVARHELSQSDGTGKGAFDISRIDLLSACHQKELFEFGAVESLSSVLLKCQCGQSIEYRVFSGVGSIVALYTDDCCDVLRLYTVFLIGTPESFAVFVHICHTFVHFHVLEKYLFVAVPGTLFLILFWRFPLLSVRRYIDRKCPLLELHMGKKSVQVGTFEVVMLHHSVYKETHFTFFGVVFCKSCRSEHNERQYCKQPSLHLCS